METITIAGTCEYVNSGFALWRASVTLDDGEHQITVNAPGATPSEALGLAISWADEKRFRAVTA